MRTNSNAFLSLKLCQILYKYKWIHVTPIFLLSYLIKRKKRSERDPSQQLPLQKCFQCTSLEQAISCHHLSPECPLLSDHGLLSPAHLLFLWGPTSLSLDPFIRLVLYSLIQSPFTLFLYLSLYLNFSFLSAIILRQCPYLSVKQCQETFVGLDLSCLSCLIVSIDSAPGVG